MIKQFEELGYYLSDYNALTDTYTFEQAPLMSTFSLGTDTLVGATIFDVWLTYSTTGTTKYEVCTSFVDDGTTVYASFPLGVSTSVSIFEIDILFNNDTAIDLSRELPVVGLYGGIAQGDCDVDATYDLIFKDFIPIYLNLDGFSVDGIDNFSEVDGSNLNGNTTFFTTGAFIGESVVPDESDCEVIYRAKNNYITKQWSQNDSYFTVMLYPYLHSSAELYEQQLLQDVHDDVAEINDTNKSILQKIIELPVTLWSKFEEGLKALFIPEDGWVEAEFDKLQTNLEDALGFLAYPFVLIEDFLSLFSDATGTGYYFTIPELEFMGHKIWDSYSADLETYYSNIGWMNTLFDVLHLFCKFIIIVALCKLGIKKFNLIMTGVNDNDS